MINKENHQIILPIKEYELLVKNVSQYIEEIDTLKSEIANLKNELEILNRTLSIKVDKISHNLREKYVDDLKKETKIFFSELEKNKTEYETKFRRLNRMAWVNKFISLILKK